MMGTGSKWDASWPLLLFHYRFIRIAQPGRNQTAKDKPQIYVLEVFRTRFE
jgi:hypothetical protein